MTSKLTKVVFFAAIVEVIILVMFFAWGNQRLIWIWAYFSLTGITLLFILLLPTGLIFSAIAISYAVKNKEKTDIIYSAIAFGIFLLILVYMFVYFKFLWRPTGLF